MTIRRLVLNILLVISLAPKAHSANYLQEMASLPDGPTEAEIDQILSSIWELNSRKPGQRYLEGRRSGVRTGIGGGGGWACANNGFVLVDEIAVDGLGQLPLISPLPHHQSASQFLEYLILELIAPAHPVLASKLFAAVQISHSSLWREVSNLPELHDRSFLGFNFLEAPESCQNSQYLQLVLRFDRSNFGGPPRSRVLANRSGLQRIRSLPKPRAILIEALLGLHEAVYILGRESLHSNSVEIVRMTHELLLKDMYFTANGRPRRLGDVSKRLVKWTRALSAFNHVMTATTATRLLIPDARATRYYQLDRMLFERLREWGIKAQISPDIHVWSFLALPEFRDSLLRWILKLDSVDPVDRSALHFLYSIRFLWFASANRGFGIAAENLYTGPHLTAAAVRQYETTFCQGIQFSLAWQSDERISKAILSQRFEVPDAAQFILTKHLGDLKILKPVLQSALGYCANIGAPELTSQADLNRFLHFLFPNAGQL